MLTLLGTLLPCRMLTGQPRPEYTIDQIITSLRGGTTPGKLGNLVATGCIVGGRLSTNEEQRLRDAKATAALILIVKAAERCAGAAVRPSPARSSLPSGLLADALPVGRGFSDREFSRIPPGRFTMRDGTAAHAVEITRPFQLQRTEVTQGQWKDVMGENPSAFKTCGDPCPVETASWEDVQLFLRRLNAMYPDKGYRLPTEAEWEYAARAGTTGDFTVDGQAVEALGWIGTNAERATHPVAQKLPNAWGLYDMHGNVWEWVQDCYAPYPSQSQTDPTGPSDGSARVLRGGSWGGSSYHARSAFRYNGTPSLRGTDVGFRLARTP